MIINSQPSYTNLNELSLNPTPLSHSEHSHLSRISIRATDQASNDPQQTVHSELGNSMRNTARFDRLKSFAVALSGALVGACSGVILAKLSWNAIKSVFADGISVDADLTVDGEGSGHLQGDVQVEDGVATGDISNVDLGFIEFPISDHMPGGTAIVDIDAPISGSVDIDIDDFDVSGTGEVAGIIGGPPKELLLVAAAIFASIVGFAAHVIDKLSKNSKQHNITQDKIEALATNIEQMQQNINTILANTVQLSQPSWDSEHLSDASISINNLDSDSVLATDADTDLAVELHDTDKQNNVATTKESDNTTHLHTIDNSQIAANTEFGH